jgi:hypothetical protein
MRYTLLLIGTAVVTALPAHAQDRGGDSREQHRDCPEVAPRPVHMFSFRTRDDARAAIGVATTSGGMRDTLGLLVTDVTPNGPADKAGIEEGDRLQAVNGTELRLAPADAGDREMRGLMVRRLVRVLDKVKAGDGVDLRVYSDGKTRTIKVPTVKASDLRRDDGVFGLGGDWMDGATSLRLDQLKDQIGDWGKRLGNLHYDMPPTSYEMRAPDFYLTPPTPPTAPTAPVPPSAPRRLMRIGGPAPITDDRVVGII